MSYSRIIGTGSYLPERILTNKDLEKMVDTSDEWIRDRTGIEKRHLVVDGQLTTDLAEHAARNALEASGKSPDEVGLIIVATCTQDAYFPSTASKIQRRLGIRNIPAFDVNAACSGFIYGLSIADQYIRTGDSKCALVVGAERMSAVVDWTQRDTCILFGDGAGAVVLEASEEQGIISTHIHSDGQYEDLLYCDVETDLAVMKGNDVFRFAVRTLERIVDETLEANQMDKSAVDWLIPHQANLRIIAATAKKLGLPLEQVVLTVAEHGNTSAASIPLAFDIAVRDGRIKRGQVLLMEAFGAGFTWGSALIRY